MDPVLLDRGSDTRASEQFSNEELSTFKRYLEENVAAPENSFEYLEENLAYYASRHTNEFFFSPAESFHVNSNYIPSDELLTNLQLYMKAVEWHSSTVHPVDSEYVIKKEKYVFTEDLPYSLSAMVNYLNQFPKQDFFVMDILVYINEEIFQYLPAKEFLFRRKEIKLNLDSCISSKINFQDGLSHVKMKEDATLSAVLPVFVPIRKMLFLGEYGYRIGMIEYGRITERLRNYFINSTIPFVDTMEYESAMMHEMLGLDGVERSVLNVFAWHQDEQSMNRTC